MNKMTKKTAFGITGAATATMLVAGFASPAMADDTSNSWDSSSQATTTTTSFADFFRTGDASNESPIVLAPSIGDIGNGNVLLSGNDVSAPVASGNETVLNDIASGNSVSGNSVSDIANGTSVSGGDLGASVGDLGASVDDLVDGGDIGANVDNLVGGILADLGIED
jgi:hypothetical protein